MLLVMLADCDGEHCEYESCAGNAANGEGGGRSDTNADSDAESVGGGDTAVGGDHGYAVGDVAAVDADADAGCGGGGDASGAGGHHDAVA
eukprot:9533955-Alexandrium_andersonii.AAC.1